MTAEEVFKNHWTKSTGKPCDEMILHHMGYALAAMEEYAKLAILKQNETLAYDDIYKIAEKEYPEIKHVIASVSEIREIFVKGFKMGLSQLAVSKQWISVEERLPEFISNNGYNKSGYVLVYPNNIACYEEGLDREWNQWYCPLYDDTIEVTHWMPLPEPPIK